MIEAFKLLGKISLSGADKLIKSLEKVENKVLQNTEKMKEFGNSMRETGEQMSAFVTLPLTALGVGAMATATQFNDSQALMQAQLGITAEKSEELSKVARAAWENGFGEDLTEATEAVSHLYVTLGDIPREELQEITEGILTLTKAFGVDQVEATTAVNTVMKNFGVNGSEALDLITHTAQNTSGVFRDDLADALTELAPTLKGMGASGAEAFNLLITASKSGMENFDGLSSLTQTFADNMIAGGEDIDEVFSGLGGTAKETWQAFKAGNAEAYDVMLATSQQLGKIENDNEKNRLGAALFGDVWTEAGADAIVSLGNAQGALKNFQGASAEAGKVLEESFGQKFQSFLREAQTSLEPLGIVLVDLAQKVLPPTIAVLTDIATWFSNLSGGGQLFVVILGIIAAAIPPLLVVLGMVANGLAFILPHVMKLSKVFKALRVVFLALTGTVGIVIAIISLLVVVGITVYKNWDKISAFLLNIWQGLANGAKKAWAAITEGIKLAVALISKLITDKFNRDKALILAIWNGLKTAATTTWNNLKNAIVQKVNDVSAQVRNKFSIIKNTIINPILEAKNKVVGFVNEIVNKFRNIRLTIPKPRVPKFTLTWGSKTFFDKEVRYPTGFDVSWGARGGIIDGASLIGAGEAGKELLMPLEGKYFKPVADMIAENINRGGGVGSSAIEIPIVLNGREIARAMVNDLDKEIERQRSIRKRGL